MPDVVGDFTAKVPVLKVGTEIHTRRYRANDVLSQLPSCRSNKDLEGLGIGQKKGLALAYRRAGIPVPYRIPQEVR